MMKILLTGGSGTLGQEILKIYNKEKYTIFSPSSKEMNVTSLDSCRAYLQKIDKPDLVLHAAAYTDVRRSEIEYISATEINVLGTFNMAKIAEEMSAKLVYISTDYVFDGKKGNYTIEDGINPLSKYAKTKAAGELIVRTFNNSLVIRTSFYGYNFPYDKALIDQWSSKDYIDILAPKILNACLSDRIGIIHIGNKRRSIYEIAKERKENVIPFESKDLGLKIPSDTSFEEN